MRSVMFAVLGGSQLPEQTLGVFRDQVPGVIIGTVFLFAGLATCGIAAIRRGSGGRMLVWLGIWCAMYGTRPLADSLATLRMVPDWFRVALPYLDTAISYLILVFGTLTFLQLVRGKLRVVLRAVILAGLAIAIAGMAYFLFTGSQDKLILYNQLLATLLLLVLLTVLSVPKLSKQFLTISDRSVLAAGTFVFTIEALYVNVARPFGYQVPSIFDALGFAALLLSLGYVALRVISANERRLLSIESELTVAREIQNSILPGSFPEFKDLRITTAYRPMTAIAGDFYDFISIDQNRIGLMVADVSGHGVPAALIAAMIKVAMQMVVACANNPGAVLGELNHILSKQLHDQFVTAAYLLIDTKMRMALYSAAGHPPLLRWRAGKLERIESNGIVFGILPQPDYPVCVMLINPGDRFLLYTDGAIEPENSNGESFGDCKLEQVFRNNQSRPASEFIDQLLFEIRQWQPAFLPQQDDITLIVIDVI